MAEVTLSGVSKVYPGGHRAVDAMDLAMPDGRCTVLVGPSGCGKTTTLRMIAGLEDPTTGTISIGGRPVNDVHPKDRDIAMVFQNYALYPHMTVYKNMAFALTLRGVPRAEIDRRVRAAARTLGIEDLLDRRPRQLSGGQRQRVAVGRAIVREPKAFLFDEPLSNLDATLRVSTRAELKALHQRLRTTTVYVTHDQEEAMTLGDQIVVMRAGRIQQVGAPLDIYRAPANRFVAGFIGTPAMNFLDGRLESTGGPPRFIPDAEPAGGLSVAAPHAQRLAARGPLVLGLRPSALREGPASPGRTLRLTITVVEPLGDTMDLHGTLGPGAGGRTLIARIPARTGLFPGSPIDLAVDMDAAHYFEPGEPGRTLLA